jgi:DNA-binding transcriptional LysR family regulator
MDLLQLRYFRSVARHQHVSRAAAELRVAQPALSRAIARLEAELGVPLFDRRGRRVRLNRFGAMFLARADRALDELEQGQRELRDAAGLAQGTVAVAAETLRTLSGLVAGFLAGHPGVSFRLFQSPAPAMAAQLQAGEVDLCLASQPLPGPALTSAELLSEEVLLAVPPSHRLAGRTRATVGELAGEPFVTTRPGYWQRALTDRLFTDAVIVCEGDDPYAIRGLISAGVGIGLMPAMARRLAPDPPVGWLHLDTRYLETPCRRTLSLVWRADAYQPAAARVLVEFAAGYFRTWRGDA